jgi:TetR/AcrR family transcriptional regulator, mexJK operon transcriptional repressor
MTDEQILAIATQLWQQSKGAGFTMERLVEATGISRATLYRRFGSRDAILQRLVDEQAIDAPELARPDVPTRIMHGARIAIGRYGLESVTIEQIAQVAGVGPATVYRHFGSREKVIETFVQASRPRELLRTFTVGEGSNIKADLTQLALTMLEFIDENRDLIRIMLFQSEMSQSLMEQMRSAQGRTATTLAHYLAEHIALGNIKAVDPFTLALSFIGMIFGLAFVSPLYYDRTFDDHATVAQVVTTIFLDGILQQQAVAQTQSEKME